MIMIHRESVETGLRDVTFQVEGDCVGCRGCCEAAMDDSQNPAFLKA